jgi:nucleoside-diphosphate-sugar epimerase
VSRVLVTGATGFIGRHALAPLVAAGHEVHATARTPGAAARGVTWHAADLLESADVVRYVNPDALLHLAWYAEHGKFWSSPENLRWLQASVALLRAFSGRRTVIAGTCAEYDWMTGAWRLAEDAPLAPATLYGACKRALHVAAEAYAREAGFSLAWGRIFFLFGPDEHPGRLVPSVLGPLLRGEEAPTTSGQQVRDFLDAPQVAQGFAALLESDVEGAVNVASGRGIAVGDLVTMLADQAGRRDLLRVGALPQRPGEPHSIVADTRRLNDEVGWRPSVSLEDALGALVRRAAGR